MSDDSPKTTPETFLRELVAQLDLETLELNLFRGRSRDLGGRSVFGGQVIGQAIVAATRTIEGRMPHSLHAYFLLPGDMNAPIVYEVDRIRDGGSFSARRVQAIQHGRPILSMIASFQVPEDGLEHQVTMPEVPPPESLRSTAELIPQWIAEAGEVHPRILASLKRAEVLEFRPVYPWSPLKPNVTEPRQAIWFRIGQNLPDAPILHRCLLAYASDFNLIGTALRPHGKSWYSPDMVVASLDHALWFHRDLRVDDWLLYSMDSPTSQGARGMTRGQVFDRRGRLVASVAQEGLLRLTDKKA
ncbi:acyl-CoA thioesterase II [Stagnimonas aquatica]|uniref:Acyl-CoA thioesterase 2 n=1 Tax=Stagnimonas aquatica TaxID=2689987 RepID=A0A3N0VJQ6_9GAMM|nr:acyl-CoA thioesterase II [Stagnimonas aquatica]ROH92979.1 acyl-CoA thioesterase II [Stagnimonas aquatica]